MPKKLKVKWPKVVGVLDTQPLIAWMDLANGTIFRIVTFFSNNLHTSPCDGLYVGIERVGSYLFDNVVSKTEINWAYLVEKLNLPEVDARPFADWMNAQLERKSEQQGIYDKKHLKPNDTEVYFNLGERASMPLKPEIIE